GWLRVGEHRKYLERVKYISASFVESVTLLDRSERFREEYRIVNVNACGVGSCDPASVASYPTGRRGNEARTMAGLCRQSRFLASRSVWRDAKHAQGSLNNASGARRRLWRLLRLHHLGDATSISSSLCSRPELLGHWH